MSPWRWLLFHLRRFQKIHRQQCPYCGYYCTGKSIYCTKGRYRDELR